MNSNERTAGPDPQHTGHGVLKKGSLVASRYLILRELARWPKECVYAAHDTEVDHEITLKVLCRPDEDTSHAVDRLVRQVILARRVTHPNVARIYDIGEHEGLHYLTVEFVDGQSLDQLLAERGHVSTATAVGIAAQICEGLAAIHQVGILHRNLRPSTILVEGAGRVVITDFGGARLLSDEDMVTLDGSTRLGNPAYMAPEQLRGEPLGVYTDLYAVGVILYQMLVGQLPDRQDSSAELNRLARLPNGLRDVVSDCLQAEPSKRPKSAAELARVLSVFGDDDPSSTVDPPVSGEHDARTSTNTSSYFAEVNIGDQSIAVLPLRYHGPPEESFIAEALTEDLADLLAMTRSLKVLATGASARFADNRDPKALREELGAALVLDGLVQHRGHRLRVLAKLIDTATCIQIWSARLDSELQDVFELQDRIAHQVAETLRLHLHHHRHTKALPKDAARLYLRARSMARQFDAGGTGEAGAAALLQKCLELAPGFAPAVASLALVSVRLWWIASSEGGDAKAWAARCDTAIAEALEHASDEPETHLAAARMHAQHGNYQESALALRQALTLAPTCAPAHAYLGALQCEAGQEREGHRHIMLALELEPYDVMALGYAVRYYALRGERERAQGMLERFRAQDSSARRSASLSRLRVAMWSGEADEVRRQTRYLDTLEQDEGMPSMLCLVGKTYLGDLSVEAFMSDMRLAMAHNNNPRLRSIVHQFEVEALAGCGDDETAWAQLQRAVDTGLVDVDWLVRCPLLNTLRNRNGFTELMHKVRQRAAVIWDID